MKKGLVIGLSIAGVLVLLCGGGIVAVVLFFVNAATALSKPADEFLTKVGSGDTAGAYQSGASALRATETPEQFAASVKSLRLDQFKSASWNKFNVVNNAGTLGGVATLKDGTSLPLEVSLVNEGGWKVAGVNLTGAGVKPPPPPAPTDAEVLALVARDMKAFRAAVHADDFTTFHAGFTDEFRGEFTPAQLRASFAQFVKQKIDLSAVGTVTPTLTQPAKPDADGKLFAVGVYKARPANIHFTLKYVYEGGGWKPFGIDVKTKVNE